MIAKKNNKQKIIPKNYTTHFFVYVLPRFFIILFILLSIAFAYFSLPYLPNKIATHWNINGVADGFGNKEDFALFFPALIIIVGTLLYFLPKYDPLVENIKKFWDIYVIFVSAVLGFFFNLQLFVLIYNMGYPINTTSFLAGSFAGLYFWTAVLLFNSKRNYIIGVKTPWALSDDENWKKTHNLGGKLFLICAAICIIPILFPEFGIILIIAPILISTVILFAYSFLIRKK